MADAIQTEVRGFDELARGTAILARRIEDGAGQAFGTVADQTAGVVAGTVPHRTGALGASAQGEQAGPVASVSMGAGIRYAPFVEYGGRGHPASAQGNYLYPAAMAAEPVLKQAGEQAASQQIRGMTWPTP